MYYVLAGPTITIDNDILKLFQPMNPSTDSKFKTKADQIEWAENFIKGFIRTDKATLSYADADGNEINSLYKDTPFKLNIAVNETGEFTIKAILFSEEIDFEQELELNFKDGVSEIDLNIDKSAKYYIKFDEPIVYTVDDIELQTYIIHELHEHLIYIGDNA